MTKDKFINKNQISERIKFLVDKINFYNESYYINNNPIVDDATYDELLRELSNLEEKYPDLVLENSPTKKVGSDLDYKNNKIIKVRHKKPVLSLSNAFSYEELVKYDSDIASFSNNYSYIVEPKIDGSHIVLTYENKQLIRACTRGNGIIGEDITKNIMYVKGIPKKINYDKPLTVHGEILIKNSDFLKINDELIDDNKFANSRNLAAGSLKNIRDPKICEKRKLMAILYDCDEQEFNQITQDKLLDFLKQNNFNVDNLYTKKCQNLTEVWNYIINISKEKINKNDIPLDGMVIKLNQRWLYDEIGYTSKVPKFNIAYKFPPTMIQTKVLDIKAQVGRTGKITYVAKLLPVNVDGVVVQNVTLHNLEYIKENDIRINDYIELYRSGMVIPKVNKVILGLRNNDVIEYNGVSFCPCCNSKLVKIKEEDVDFFCVNENCDQKKINGLIHFCSRDAMNIEGLSEKTIEKLYNSKMVTKVSDFYHLEQYKNEIINSDWKIKDKLFQKIIDQINASKNNSLERLLYGLGIKNIGKNYALILAKKFNNIDNLINATIDELNNIKDIGSTIINSIFDWFKLNYDLILELKLVNVNMNYLSKNNYEIDKQNFIYGKKICITGKFDNYSRDELKEIIENKYGGYVVSNISKNTDFVLVGQDAGTKLEKAKTIKSIQIIDNLDWLN